MKTYNVSLARFKRVFFDNFGYDNIDIFNNNLKDIKITEAPYSISSLLRKLIKNNPAVYINCDNTILLIKNDIPEFIIFHELFHAASSLMEDDMIYSGFRQYDFKTRYDFGYGLNEGYTQYMKEKYFGQDPREKYVYLVEKHFASLLEEIVGEKNMECFYLQANLKKLYDKLQDYIDYDKITRFMKNLDFFKDHVSSKKDDRTLLKINNKIKDCSYFLLDAFIEKEKQKLRNNEINKDEFDDNVAEFINKLDKDVYFKDYMYYGVDRDYVDTFYDNSTNKVR